VQAFLSLLLLSQIASTVLALFIVAVSVVQARPRWTAIGSVAWALFVCRELFPGIPKSPIPTAGAENAVYIYFSILFIRRLFNITDNEHAYEQNRKLIGTIFGRGAAQRYSASIDRMRDRAKKAKEKGVGVLEIMKEEHTLEKRGS
jgi:hypothetical protein